MRLLVLALAALAIPSLNAADTISARVSQTVAPMIESVKPLFAKAHPDLTISVTGCPTGASLKAVGGGEAQLGGSVRALKPEEKTLYPDLVLTAFARDGVALVIKADNAVSNLTKAQCTGILSGTITNWKDVGGADEPIMVIGRTEANAIVEFVEQYFGLVHRVEGDGKAQTMSFKAKDAVDFGTMKMVITGTHKEALAQLLLKPGTFTYVPLGLANDMVKRGSSIKIVSLDGVTPTKDTVVAGTYPLNRSLYLITKGEAQGPVKELIDLMLSPEGQSIVAERGCIPIK